jgi:hypothetical protein
MNSYAINGPFFNATSRPSIGYDGFDDVQLGLVQVLRDIIAVDVSDSLVKACKVLNSLAIAGQNNSYLGSNEVRRDDQD